MKELKCRRCGKAIHFDPKKRSKYGRQIPLDPDTNKPHDCQKLNLEQSKPSETKSKIVHNKPTKATERKLNCLQCGKEIYFGNLRTKKGKLIPLDPVTKKSHKCSRSKYERSNALGSKIKDLQERDRERIKRHHQIESDEDTWGWE